MRFALCALRKLPVTRKPQQQIMPELTTDTLFDGRVRVQQYRNGYRFSTDAVLLAGHLHPRTGDTVIDLGTGCGVIPLILAYRHPEIKITGVEVQTKLAEIATANVTDNGLSDRVDIVCIDLKKYGQTAADLQADVVVSNPPYRKADAGRLNPDPQRAIARHEIMTTLSEVLDTAQRILRNGGKFVSVYTVDRMVEMMNRMQSSRIEPKRVRMIHANLNTDAKMMLIEGIKGARPGLKIAPPLIIHRNDGSYTDEVQKMFKP